MALRLSILTGFAVTSVFGAIAPATPAFKSWRDYGGTPDQSKFVRMDDITKENVHLLEIAWTYPQGDERSYQFNPVIVDGVMYVLAKNSSLVAVDVATGERGYQFHRRHRNRGTRPVARGRFFALAVARRRVHEYGFASAKPSEV